MNILGIDPGPTESAIVMYRADENSVTYASKLDNVAALLLLDTFISPHIVIEKIASFGMAVGAEVFETCVWTGRFIERAKGLDVHRVTRMEVKMHLCHNSRAKDANIRQAIIDRFGGKDAAIGKKAAPGPLYGIAGDCWSALAVAITFAEKNAAVPNVDSQLTLV